MKNISRCQVLKIKDCQILEVCQVPSFVASVRNCSYFFSSQKQHPKHKYNTTHGLFSNIVSKGNKLCTYVYECIANYILMYIEVIIYLQRKSCQGRNSELTITIVNSTQPLQNRDSGWIPVCLN